MTKEELMTKDAAVGEAVVTCLETAENLIEANSGEGEIRGLFIVYCDMTKVRVRSVGHSLAIDAAFRKASSYMLARQHQEIERIEEEGGV